MSTGKDIEGVSSLIPGLPDDISERCLAVLGRRQIYSCRIVCKAWKIWLESEEMFQLRRNLNAFQELLYFFEPYPGLISPQVFDPREDDWKCLPTLPIDESHTKGLRSFKCLVIKENIFLIGGMFSSVFEYSNKVYMFDCIAQRWVRKADMSEPRCDFCCGAFDNKIIVAGGGLNNPTVEMYDVDLDTWTPLPEMIYSRSLRGCTGHMIQSSDGIRFYIMGGEFHDDFDFEYLDMNTMEWNQVVSSSRQILRFGRPRMVQLSNSIYTLANNCVWMYQFDLNHWINLASPGNGDTLVFMFAFCGKLYVLAGRSSLTYVFDPMTNLLAEVEPESSNLAHASGPLGSRRTDLSACCIVGQGL